MNPSADIEFTRQVATALTLTGKVEGDTEHFFELPVLLTSDSQFLKTKNGEWIFWDLVLLLIRMTKRLTIEVRDNDQLASDIHACISGLTAHKAEILTSSAVPTGFEAIVSVGSRTNSSLPWTAVNSNGWVARVSSGPTDLSNDCSEVNPIGALAAASLAVAEVFKRLVRLEPRRGPLHDNFAFSFYSYSHTNDPGPAIPRLEIENVLLVGAGAIGNGVCQLFRQLPIKGSLAIVDYQDFQEENLGTCLLASTQDLGRSKAEVLASLLSNKLEAVGYKQDLATFMNTRLGVNVPYPRIILTGLDNIETRRQVQTIWPDVVIDGAIGPLSCQVTLHPWGPDLSCLMCDFEEPTIAATKVQSDLTGLAESRLENLLDVVSEDDVKNAPPEKRDFLAKNLGKQFCALLSEAELVRISQKEFKEGFQPSVPFVACLSACMMVTELIRINMKDKGSLETGFQFDTLVGPQNGIFQSHARKKSCICTDRRRLIETWRERRY